MAKPDTIDWINRGRSFLDQGASVDALLALRRAVKTDPRDWAAHYWRAEAARRLGRSDEAREALQDGIAVGPSQFEPMIALAESALASGAYEFAATAAGRAGRVAPAHPLPLALHALARILGQAAKASAFEQVLPALVAVLRHDPSLLARPALLAALNAAIEATDALVDWEPVLEEIANDSGLCASLPWQLWVRVVEHSAGKLPVAAVDALVAPALQRECASTDLDALRRIALMATKHACAVAPLLRERYAVQCLRLCATSVPLLWPQRTAGSRLRVVVVSVDDPGPVASAALSALDELEKAGYDLTRVRVAPDEPRRNLPSEFVLVKPDPGTGDGGFRYLPPEADQAARHVALLDPDVVVDLAGLAARVGPILAQRPGRRLVTLAGLSAVAGAPIADVVAATPAELVEVICGERAAIASHHVEGVSATELALAWDSAVRAHQRGDLDQARAGYDRVLELQPNAVKALYLRAMLARGAGENAAARVDLAAAIRSAPTYVDAIVAAAEIASNDGAPEAAAAICAATVDGLTDPVRVLRAWGLAELQRRDGAAAQERFERALALAPEAAETHYNHGVSLQMQRKLGEAARAYQRALALDPALVAADFNLGVLFQEQGAIDAAVAAYSTVLAQDPNYLEAYRHRGETLLNAGRLEAALDNLQRFEAAFADSISFATHALEVYQRAGDFAGVDRCLDGLRLERFQARSATELCDELEQLLYLVLFFDIEPSVVFRLYQAYDEASRRQYGVPMAWPNQRPPGRIRIGYLSADLRDHVMGKMVWQQVQHHDRARFAVHFYALNENFDEWTERFRQRADGFVGLSGTSDQEAAARIRGDDLDLLVDLSTHTKGARPGILALKPARVVLTHVASAGCVGLSTIDFKLTDRYADLPESQEFQFETFLPMEGCAYPYRSVDPAPDHPFDRQTLGIAADAVLIGAFFVSLKLSRRCMALWREVLERIPRARLVFSPANPAHRESYAHLVAASGIAADRVLFLPQGRNEAENQARYELIDFVLDPMPYGGVNGTLEALGMGVPVVTLVGRRHAERTTYSMLVNLGVTQTIATSGREYVEIASRLADDAVFKSAVRAAITAGLVRSTLTDAVGHTRNLEAAYERALAQRFPAALIPPAAVEG